MFDSALGISLTVIAMLVAIGCCLVGLAHWWHRRSQAQALRSFSFQRERLEATFFDLASRLGKPRGLRWIDCDWQPAVEFARDRESGLLTAFVAVNIRFEAVEGGDMEDVEAVGLIRDAAAVFHYQAGRWGTGGRALFNMNPEDALSRLSQQFEAVSVDDGANAQSAST